MWYYFIYLQLSIIHGATHLAKHSDSVQGFFFPHSGLWVDGSSTLQSLNKIAKPLRKTDGKIFFFHSLVMEMDAQ